MRLTLYTPFTLAKKTHINLLTFAFYVQIDHAVATVFITSSSAVMWAQDVGEHANLLSFSAAMLWRVFMLKP